MHSRRPESEVVEFPVIQICNSILHTAVSERASDVHVEPKETSTVVRYRVDGDMRDALTLKCVTGMKLVSRLKILGDLDIAEKRKPQDGAFAAIIGGRTFNVRLSTTFTPNGESVVMRLLEPYTEPKDLRELGMADEQVRTVMKRVGGDKGMVLVVGPTGSGKTTTVYSLLHSIDARALSVMSVEDPVEYRIPFVNQHQVNDKAGVSFESLLKTAVRQDPDILFLGEMRDGYSAKVAVDFASTGHLTVTTLHTADATSAIFRLERLGLARGEMADSLAVVVAQRLVRKLCQRCREVAAISQEERAMLSRFTDDVPARVGRPVGCQDCNYTGYYGREGVYEVIEFDSEVAGMVRSNVSIREIRSRLHARGKGLMGDHGVAKVRSLVLAPKDLCEQVPADEVDAGGPALLEAEPSADAAGPAPAAVSSDAETHPEHAERASSILVVEDDPDARKRMVGWLKDGGYDISVCVDGIEALISLGKKEYDLVVTATVVANLDGFKLLEMINEKEIDVPVLLTAAMASNEDEEKGMKLGAVDYVRKDVGQDVFVARVRRALVHSRRSVEAGALA
jgi:type II secretory ATPase GspE/PulE/Tfp pilus assembly ATPase PilB-like protein/CheY-like chemotaxis protein